MAEKSKNKTGWALAIGIVVGVILYKVIVDVLWPLVF